MNLLAFPDSIKFQESTLMRNKFSLYIHPFRKERHLFFTHCLNMILSKSLCFFVFPISSTPGYFRSKGKRIMLQEKTWKVSGNCHFLMLWGDHSQVPSPPVPRGLWTALTSSSIYTLPNSFGTSALRMRSKSCRQYALSNSIISHILFYL